MENQRITTSRQHLSHVRLSQVVGLVLIVGTCTQTLDAGHRRSSDLCSSRDAGCIPTGLLDNLVGYWRLDDGMGSAVAYDSSGRGNEGVLHAIDPNSAWVIGRSSRALEMAHTGWVQVPPSPSIDAITDSITLSAWVNLESAIGTAERWATVLSRQTGKTNYQHYHIALYMSGLPSLFLITVSGYVVIHAADPVTLGVWTHMAGVYDGRTARLYVNGTEVASQALTGTFGADTTPIILGGNVNDASGIPTELVPGRIDEVMLYARALSASEISQIASGVLFQSRLGDASVD